MINSQFRKVRKQQGLTLAELADRSHVTVANISRFERGELDVRLSTLLRLAEALGIDIMPGPIKRKGIADIQTRMARGAARLRAAGMAVRDTEARLRWKESRGVDVGVERRLLDKKNGSK